jgi:hypothetical protein
MSRNGSGQYNLPAGNPVVSNTTISSTWANTTLQDIGSALTQSIAKDGQTVATGNLPMGGFRHTNVAPATQANEYARLDQVQSGSSGQINASGTNTITATGAPPVMSYVTGSRYSFIADATNTGPVTLNIDTLGATPITKYGTTPLSPGDIVDGGEVFIIYDGTQFQLINPVTVPYVSDLVSPYNLDKSTQGFAMVNGKLDVSVSANALTVSIKTINSGLSAITSLVGGTGYTDAPTISFTGGGGSGAQAVATVAAGAVTAITITNPGKNYTSVPTIVITGVGSGASATAVIGNPSTLDPVIATFRSATDSSGSVDVVKVTSATSITVPDTATLGTVNATLSRIWVSMFNNSGTAVLGVTNISGDFSYGDDIIASGTAISTASDNVNVNYTSTAVTSKGMRVLGYIESTQATAGTWATAPSRVANETAVFYARPPRPSINSGTTVTATSGTSVDLTGIPAGVKRVTITPYLISGNGTSSLIVQGGTGSTPTYVTTGYTSFSANFSTGSIAGGSITNGIPLINDMIAADNHSGSITLNKVDGNKWTGFGTLATTSNRGGYGSGSVDLGAELTAIRVTFANGTQTFDGALGLIGISWEF